MSRSIFRAFADSQVRLSKKVDTALSEKYRTVGMEHFDRVVLQNYLKPNLLVYDVGGGSRPVVSREVKEKLNLRLVGVDIDGQELEKAPPGVYDKTIVADITKYRGVGDADLIVCQATMEHVRDTDGAFASLSSMLKPGGRLLIVVPSRNAVFARMNLALPEGLKRRVLFSVFPHKAMGHDGFPAFYNRCTPKEFRRMAAKHGLSVEQLVPYYYSSYFSFFVPLFVVWRAWVVAFSLMRGEQAAEVFSIVCSKPAH
jgi:SAM-dependent methyltransferase